MKLDELPQPLEETTTAPDELKVDGDNPNEQSDEMFGLLCDNMREKGWLGNAIVADADGVISDGEHRWRAAQEIGLEEVPVKLYDIDDSERRLWRQELNKISGEHDKKRDALEYDELLSSGYTDEVEALTDANDEDLDELLAEISVDNGVGPAYDYDPEHNVYFEDCVEGMRERLDNNSVDCVITDPPYGIDYQSNHPQEEFDKLNNDEDLGDAVDLFEAACSEFARVLKPNGHLYVCTRWDVFSQFQRIVRHHFEERNCLVWAKNNWGMGNPDTDYLPQHELVIFAHGDNPREINGRHSDLLEYPRTPMEEYTHPTEKPITLIEELVEASTDEGDIVLDPFMGSGTTAVAAIWKDRDYVGFEIDEDNYRDVIERRIGEAKRAQKAEVNQDG